MPRQYIRFPYPMEIVLDFSSGSRGARVSDLSLGGCFVDTILDVSEGETTDFELRLPTGQWLKLSGEVVYTMPQIGFGIRFAELSQEQVSLLEETIERYGGKPHDKDDGPADEA